MFCCGYWTQRGWSSGAPSRPRYCTRARCASIAPPATLSRRTRCLPNCMRPRYAASASWCSVEIATYRWALPDDTAPLLRLIDALGRDEIDLVAFTSASQASNLFVVAQYDGKEALLKQSLGRTLVASIGPVCSIALRKLAVRVDIEAKPPRLGPLIEAINAALSDRRPLGKS
jgi:hypothetical protein